MSLQRSLQGSLSAFRYPLRGHQYAGTKIAIQLKPRWQSDEGWVQPYLPSQHRICGILSSNLEAPKRLSWRLACQYRIKFTCGNNSLANLLVLAITKQYNPSNDSARSDSTQALKNEADLAQRY